MPLHLGTFLDCTHNFHCILVARNKSCDHTQLQGGKLENVNCFGMAMCSGKNLGSIINEEVDNIY